MSKRKTRLFSDPETAAQMRYTRRIRDRNRVRRNLDAIRALLVGMEVTRYEDGSAEQRKAMALALGERFYHAVIEHGWNPEV